ncbi:Histidine kinase-, DNA gyrase B-, and HSP90-like ATPase [Paenibacillus sp. UNC496MF]|nr:Histidine kinase-, DNA gyrase B-, and HSP90-like ATPase [Paenibacillus sp. UNC496MF]
MIFYFFALSAASAVLLLANPRGGANRWAAFFLACAAVGGLEGTLREAGLPRIADAAVYVNQTWTPYGILAFSLTHAEKWPKRRRTRALLQAALLIPAAATLAVTPLEPAIRVDFGLLLCWVGPYYAASCWVLLRALLTEADPRRRRGRLLTTLIIVPTVLAALAFINVARAIEPDFDFFAYISVFVIYSLAMALLCVFMYGFLGVKLRLERDPLDATMEAVSSGTTMLNHTIKNEIGKISLSTLNLGHRLPDADDEARQHLAIISQSSAHLLDMVTRIHGRTKAIVLREQPHALEAVVRDCLARCADELEARGIAVSFGVLERPVLTLDAVHVREAVGNLIANAAEAMERGGRLRLTLEGNKRHVLLTVADDGPGIPKELQRRVLEPFFSTKSRTDNYGLGLSYAYNVMLLSGGTLAVSSEPGRGARVTLAFPRKKQLRKE